MSEEARLPRIDADHPPDEVKPAFDAFIAERGKVPNLFRIAAHVPRISAGLAALQSAVMGPGEVPVLLKELLATRVSHINHCEYCLASHGKLARRHGATEEQFDAVARASYESFEADWRAALTFADEVTPTPGIASNATYSALASHWNTTQIVEITAVISMFNLFNRFANALTIPITT